jgi:DNA-binding response OmpR family regulator
MYALLLARNTDDKAILSLVLQRAGLAVTTGDDLERAAQSWSERPADLIVLALDAEYVPSLSRLRSVTDVPVILVADRLDESAHCKALEAGADLVVQRPYGARLLITQVRALLRRAGGVQFFSLPTLSLADLTLDPASRTVQVAGRPSCRLTHLEFRLLYSLMIHPDQVLSTETIVERVWGYSGRGDKELVRGLVRRLRGKIEPDPRNPQYIVTAPGIGYSFQSQEA